MSLQVAAIIPGRQALIAPSHAFAACELPTEHVSAPASAGAKPESDAG